MATLAPMVASAAPTDPAVKEQMIGDLEFIRNTFRVMYAPAEWKRAYAGWDLESEYRQAKERIQNSETISTKDFQRVVRDFLHTTQDYHVSAQFRSTETAALPFRVKEAEGRYFLSDIDQNLLSPALYKLNIGDELVMFDGRPADEVVSELMTQGKCRSIDATDRALAAEIFLTFRSGVFGQEVPKGPVTITVKPKHSEKLATYQLIWEYTPEKIKYDALQKDVGGKTLPAGRPLAVMAAPFAEIKEERTRERMKEVIGAKRSFIPNLGEILWKTDEENPFHAYLYKSPDERVIGYVRIPSYVGECDKQAKEFAAIIAHFEDHADALVIDQVNNPGGAVLYVYALASMLTDQPLKTPKHKMSLTHADIEMAVSEIALLEAIECDRDAQNLFGETIAGYPASYQTAQFFLNLAHFMIDEWNAGRTLTNPSYIEGVDHINPHPSARFTKPILLLTNHLDFSGGDFFPAILQDNKRATILGSRTAGAGGYVLSTSFPNRFGIAGFRYTASLAERADKSPIENLGVTPDIPYEITVEDLQSSYQGYIQAIHQAVHGLLK